MGRTFEILTTAGKHPRLTVTPERTTLKIPDTGGWFAHVTRLVQFGQFVESRVLPVETSWRGQIELHEDELQVRLSHGFERLARLREPSGEPTEEPPGEPSGEPALL